MQRGSFARISLTMSGALAAAALLTAPGCGSPDFFANNITLRTGSVNLQFINNTDFRAAFTFGVYDGLNLSPGAVSAQQTRVEPRTASDLEQLACRRVTVLGTRELIDRAVDADFEDGADFDRDAFVVVINFSDAPADDPAAAQPTVGFAAGKAVLLGVDYNCGDRLIFTFEQDPDAPGGFRVDFANLPADDDDR